MRRSRQVIRPLGLLKALQQGERLHVDQLAARFHVRRELMYRDLRALEELRFPIAGFDHFSTVNSRWISCHSSSPSIATSLCAVPSGSLARSCVNSSITSPPSALIGGVVAIFFTGKVMSVPSLIGLISVFGIAARNGIILVSHYRQLRAEGESKDLVIVEGSKDRLAPVLMTAAAAALGLLPLLFGDATGKELERPMAQVILGGLFTSTFLNMIVVPTLFRQFGWEAEEAFQQQLALERGELFGPGIPSSAAPAPNPRGSLKNP